MCYILPYLFSDGYCAREDRYRGIPYSPLCIGQWVLPKFIAKNSKGAAPVFMAGDSTSPLANITPASSARNWPTTSMDCHPINKRKPNFFAPHILNRATRNCLATHPLRPEILNYVLWQDKGKRESYLRLCIEYSENLIVVRDGLDSLSNPIIRTDYLSGILRLERRLLNVRVLRHADRSERDIHDISFPLQSLNRPSYTLGSIDRFSRMMSLLVWSSRRSCVSMTELLWMILTKVYGVDPAQGALAVIRTDGYIGIVARLDNAVKLDEYLKQ
ncbi:hypothetical protein N7510_006618 [Penicillium lagena]|uniref:uncharacterized protein n=1 Tax=Penicillium lagena TaxID=94218 RepID=UPI00253FA01C|nr:uncharacterized protein N7510_006618 [Penicillium lagena]KAJ5613424.1 hypothetical protein N7510_006618 [Penicillium lagena]